MSITNENERKVACGFSLKRDLLARFDLYCGEVQRTRSSVVVMLVEQLLDSKDSEDISADEEEADAIMAEIEE